MSFAANSRGRDRYSTWEAISQVSRAAGLASPGDSAGNVVRETQNLIASNLKAQVGRDGCGEPAAPPSSRGSSPKRTPARRKNALRIDEREVFRAAGRTGRAPDDGIVETVARTARRIDDHARPAPVPAGDAGRDRSLDTDAIEKVARPADRDPPWLASLVYAARLSERERDVALASRNAQFEAHLVRRGRSWACALYWIDAINPSRIMNFFSFKRVSILAALGLIAKYFDHVLRYLNML